MRCPTATALLLPCLVTAGLAQDGTPVRDGIQSRVQTGIDALQQGGFAALRGHRVGLITNQTGIDRTGRRTVDVLNDAREVDLRTLFSPEHGFAGVLEQRRIADAADRNTGLKIYSLYGETRKPTAAMLEGIDTLVFDIQDIGCRFYTYISTMGLAMEAAAEHGLRFVVLDRPNPIGGEVVSGPLLDPDKESFVGFHPIPVRHGMTIGELAQMFRAERGLELDLRIVRVRGWKRAETFDRTGLYWVNPSPNMRSLTAAMLYPGIGLLETTNLSVGRGTDTPFEVIGAPWLNGPELAAHLNTLELPGVRFIPLRFTPTASVFANQPCSGLNITITDWSAFRPLPTGIQIACALRDRFGEDWRSVSYLRLLGNEAAFAALQGGRSAEAIQAGWNEALIGFAERRAQYLLYE